MAGWFDDLPKLWRAFDVAARRAAEAAHPERATLAAAAEAARAAAEVAGRALAEARREDDERAARFGNLGDTADPATRLDDAERDLSATREQLAATRTRIATLQGEPAGRRGPSQLDRQRPRPVPAKQPIAPERRLSQPRPEDLRHLGYLQHRSGPGRGIGR
ncbi:hypothetical protein SAMN06272737_11499 [Blastococcus mobilis]|uniref:Uncharacterized protein n=1 Tax=Blastococcus mobilis TaxID=1938746 RepID=A0A238XL39_9ACTN|nr:hypothetical protein SAMN06272737_11499 [Blastococcus mobilis]